MTQESSPWVRIRTLDDGAVVRKEWVGGLEDEPEDWTVVASSPAEYREKLAADILREMREGAQP